MDKRILAKECIDQIGQTVNLAGWVNGRRDHGQLIFIDLRDTSGLVQIVVTKKSAGYQLAKETRPEWVITVSGKVQKRPDNMVNPDLETGAIEVSCVEIKILSRALTPPFDMTADTNKIDEETRLKYRYLDLRSPRLKKNLLLRQQFIAGVREYLTGAGFFEIETPILTRATPEGARDFLVPSRKQPGSFYALPQSPQQYKQLLMVAGFEKYFQITKCFRDEDTRADRLPEFSQIDLEMSFVSEEDIYSITEDLISAGIKQLKSNHQIKTPFPRITWQEADKKYHSDRPDLRKDKNDVRELAFSWVTDFPMFEYKPGLKRWTAAHHPFTALKDTDLKLLDTPDGWQKATAQQYDLVLNGFEVGGGSIRTTDPQTLVKVFKVLGYPPEEVRAKFGHLLDAFQYGVPPHGGIAIGLDRLIAVLCGEKYIREVIAFPKTGDGRDPMMGTPDAVDNLALKELGLKIESKQQLPNSNDQ